MENKEDQKKIEKGKGDEKESDQGKKEIVSDEGKQLGDISTILDIIGGIKYAISEQTIKTSDFVTDQIFSLSALCEMKLNFIDSVPFNYTIWKDLPNEVVYVLNKPLYGAVFSDCDTFVINRLSCREKMIDDAKNILREPRTEVIGSNLVYVPSSLGIDYENLYSLRMDDNERQTINAFCRKGKVEGCFAKIRTRTDLRVANLRRRIMMFSSIEMNEIGRRARQYVEICSNYCSEAAVVLKSLNAWQQPLPFCSPFLQAGIFDNLKRAPQLRYEYIVSIFAPDIKLTPIPFADMMRIASVSMVRASFITDFIQQSFRNEWSEPISWYISSWLSLGDLLLELNDSDVSQDQTLKAVIASVFFLASIVYDHNGVYSNTTISSIRKACRHIYEWALSKNLINRANVIIPNDDGLLTLLSNSTVKARNTNLTNIDLQRIGGMNGVAGANVDADLPIQDDEPLRRFFPGISIRRNVAINVDDYRTYMSEDANYMWPLEDSINCFMRSHSDLTPYSGIVAAMLTRLRIFYVRLNEYMRLSHYNIFTRSQKATNFVRRERSDALIVPINSMIFPYMCRSWPTLTRFEQKYSCIDRLKMQSGFNASMIDTSLRLKTINLSYERLSVLNEISSSKRLELACQKYSHLKHIYEILKSVRDEGSLIKLLNSSFYINDPYYKVFDDIDLLSNKFLVVDGVMPEFNVHYSLNRLTVEMINEAIVDQTYLHNFNDFEGQDLYTMDYPDISYAFMKRYYKMILYNSNERFYKFKVLVPYNVEHSLPSSVGKILVESVATGGPDLTLRKCLKVSPLTISLVLVDGRDYNVPDSFVPEPFTLECSFPPTRFKNQIIMKRSEFISNLYADSVLEQCIVGSNFSFASVLSLEEPK